MVVEQYCPAFDRCTVESPINSLRDWGRWTAPVTWNWVSNTPACINRRCIQESISEKNDGWIKVAKHGDCGERQKNGERKNAKKSGCQGARQRRRAKKGNYRLPAPALITIQGVKLWRQFGVKTITKTNSRTKNWFLCRMNFFVTLAKWHLPGAYGHRLLHLPTWFVFVLERLNAGDYFG